MPQINQMNQAQLQAVMHGEGPLLVLAGPGSGKTTVIVNRILYLINHRQISPENILVVTFTKDAALSMQNRFVKEAGECLAVNFGTFHSVFYHILRESKKGQFKSQIITQSKKKNMMLGILKEITAAHKKYYDVDALKEDAEGILDAISLYKNTQDEATALKKMPENWKEDFQNIFQWFRRQMQKQDCLDFDDMVYECREVLLKNKDILMYWQNRFSHILVDEFQDISPMQYEVLKLLGMKHNNVLVVGDDDQAIYGFRGSKPACIRQFAEDFRAKQVVLNANYRSTQEIVAASGKVIEVNKDRFVKNCYAAGDLAEGKNSVQIRMFGSGNEELEWILKELMQFQKESCGERCAVLFRTNTQMQRLATVMKRENIPFAMRGQTGNLYEHFIAKDIMAYLQFAKGDCRRELFLRIMNRPVRYLDREAVGEMNPVDLGRLRVNYARRGKVSDAAAMQEIDEMMRCLNAINRMSPAPAVIYISKAVGYEAYLRSKAQNGEQLDEWMEILDFLKREAEKYGDLNEWIVAQKRMNEAEHKRDMRRDTKRDTQSITQNQAIYLMTVHASKGLEFDRVMIPDCNEKVFPYGNMPDKETVEEERRIFYVGMTRAQKTLELLCLSGSKERPRVMSRFLNPIVKDYPPKQMV